MRDQRSRSRLTKKKFRYVLVSFVLQDFVETRSRSCGSFDANNVKCRVELLIPFVGQLRSGDWWTFEFSEYVLTWLLLLVHYSISPFVGHHSNSVVVHPNCALNIADFNRTLRFDESIETKILRRIIIVEKIYTVWKHCDAHWALLHKDFQTRKEQNARSLVDSFLPDKITLSRSMNINVASRGSRRVDNVTFRNPGAFTFGIHNSAIVGNEFREWKVINILSCDSGQYTVFYAARRSPIRFKNCCATRKSSSMIVTGIEFYEFRSINFFSSTKYTLRRNKNLFFVFPIRWSRDNFNRISLILQYFSFFRFEGHCQCWSEQR